MSRYGNKYDNWTDWKTDPRKHCRIDGYCQDISHYYWNFYNPDDKIYHGDGYDIDHDNGDHSDNSKKNLIKRTHPDHISRHNIGKTHTPETIEKFRAANTGENNPMFGKYGKDNPRSKKVLANFTEYSSGKEAAKALGVAPQTIRRRILANKPGYHYINKDG